jgi:hypothetical protein
VALEVLQDVQSSGASSKMMRRDPDAEDRSAKISGVPQPNKVRWGNRPRQTEVKDSAEESQPRLSSVCADDCSKGQRPRVSFLRNNLGIGVRYGDSRSRSKPAGMSDVGTGRLTYLGSSGRCDAKKQIRPKPGFEPGTSHIFRH